MRISTVVLAALVGAMLPASASAEPISYQGQFQDGGQIPVGNYDLRFRVFDAPAGGNVVGQTLERSVTLTGADAGVFTLADLDFGAGVFGSGLRWMEVAIRTGGVAYTVLSPRQPITWVPQALYAGKSGTTLNDAYLNGAVIDNAFGPLVQMTGGLVIGTPTSDGLFRLFQSGLQVPVVQMFTTPGFGGGMFIRDEAAATMFVVQPDPQGTGATMTLAGDGGQLAFDGDVGAGPGSGSRLSLTGPTSSFVFDTTVAGNASVVLPGSSIGPEEMFAEPGVAGSTRVNGVALGTNFATVTSRTITVPAPGFVVAFASCRLSVQRPSSPGVLGTLIFGLSETPGAIPDTQRTVLQMPGSALTPGLYSFPGSAHGVFEVESAGDHTFYFNARQTSFTSGTALDTNLTLLYFPTAYGSVDAPLLSIQGGYWIDAGVESGLSREQILAEQLAEQTRAMEQMRAEQADLRRQFEEIKARLPRGNFDR